MSLKLLLASLQSGRCLNGTNALVQIVHECYEEFGEQERKQDADVASVKEMVVRLEERVNERIEGVRLASSREVDVVSVGLDALVRRVGNLEVDPR